MARAYSANTHILTSTNTANAPGSVGTVAFWFRPTWNGNDGVRHTPFRAYIVSTDGKEFCLVKAADNNLYTGWIHGGGGDFDELVMSATGVFTANTWAHYALTWTDPGDRIELFKNGASIGLRTLGLITYSPGTGYAYGVGSVGLSGIENSCDGSMAEWGQWSSVLGAGDIAALAKGFAPPLVSPSTLDVYMPIAGNVSPEPNYFGPGYTATGPTKSDHPAIIY